jgi:hypothetical protein
MFFYKKVDKMDSVSSAIVLSSVIITLGGLAITISLITKKKGLAIFLFVFFIILLAFIFIFNDLISTFMKSIQKSSVKSSKSISSKTLNLNDINKDKRHLKDLIYYWGEPFFISYDSSIVLFNVNSGISTKKNTGEWGTYLYKTNREEIQKFFKSNLSNSNGYLEINYNSDGFVIVKLNNLYADFIGILRYNAKYINNDISGWSWESITKSFGKTDDYWVSTNFLSRVYKLENKYLYFENNKLIYVVFSFNNNYDINSLNMFSNIYGQVFTKENK